MRHGKGFRPKLNVQIVDKKNVDELIS